jgi:hypothetical protein
MFPVGASQRGTEVPRAEAPKQDQMPYFACMLDATSSILLVSVTRGGTAAEGVSSCLGMLEARRLVFCEIYI